MMYLNNADKIVADVIEFCCDTYLLAGYIIKCADGENKTIYHGIATKEN